MDINAGTVTGAAVLLAFFVESLLEYVFGIWWRPGTPEQRAKVLMAVGLVLGIGLALTYRVDLPAELGLSPSIIGQIVTGALIGRGSEYLHAVYKKLKPS